MTAYKNRKAALAVTAGLVGALTLGGAAVGVPAAYAEAELTSVQPGTPGVEGLGVDDGQGGSVKAVDGTYQLEANTNTWLNVSLEDGQTAYYHSDNAGKVGAQLVGYKSHKPVTNENAKFYFGGESTQTSSMDAVKPGKTYWVVVKNAKGEEVASAQFKYVESAVTYAAYNKLTGGTTFTYNGAQQVPVVKDSNGNPISESSLRYYDADGKPASGDPDAKTAPTWAGTYSVKWQDANSEWKSVSYTIEKLDLSKAAFGVADFVVADAPAKADFLSKVTVSGSKQTATGTDQPLSSFADVTKVTAPNGSSTFGNSVGKYTVEVSAKSKDGGSVTGTASITYYVLNIDLTASAGGSAQYGVTKPQSSYTIDLSTGASFDASKVKYVAGGKTYRGDQVEVSYTDTKSGKAVDASALANPGEYEIKVRVKPFTQNGQFTGGSATMTIEVAAAAISANEGVTFKFDGETVADKVDGSGSFQSAGVKDLVYDGSDFLKSVATEVADSDGKAYEAGKDYKVVVTKEGKEVDKIVDAGEYKVTVEPVTFEKVGNDADWQLTVEVSPATVSGLKSYVNAQDFTGKYTELGALAYTGSAIEVPQAQYKSGDAYVALDPSLYTVVSVKKGGKAVKEIKGEGDYAVRIALTDAAKGNYKLADRDFTVQVSKFDTFFQDVAAPEWYAKPVAQAKVNGYVNGISGTQLFAPKADITRADAVCILFNMAGGDSLDGDWEFSYTDGFGYKTGFSDVDGKAYYAKALAWAKASGVANGYGDGTFKPAAQISREEFAALLCNYAKMSGRYAAPSSDALSGVSDASTVSAWAKDVVNWAVSEKVMGNGGFVAGQARITRAEVAAMGVNFQPETL